MEQEFKQLICKKCGGRKFIKNKCAKCGFDNSEYHKKVKKDFLNKKNISPPKAKAMGIRNGRTI